MKAKLILYTLAAFFFWAYFSILRALWARLMGFNPLMMSERLFVVILIIAVVPLSLLSASFLIKKITNKSV